MSDFTPTSRVAGKTAVVTGGTTGIGLEIARRLIEEGARVLITSRNAGNIERALAELGPNASGIVADSQKLADLDTVAATARERLGRIDILVANAGGGVFAPLSSVDEALFDQQFDLNVKGLFFTVQKLLPLFDRGTSVILTASAVHAKGAPGGSLYFASKAAVRSFARTLAAELGEQGIRVNSLSPGITPTQFFHNSNVGLDAYGQFEQMAGVGSPLGRAGTAREMANAALFLASNESSYMTAADLVVDGGWSNV